MQAESEEECSGHMGTKERQHGYAEDREVVVRNERGGESRAL